MKAILPNLDFWAGGPRTRFPSGTNYYNDSIRFGYQVVEARQVFTPKRPYNGEEFENGFPLIDFSDLRGTLGANYQYSPKTSFFLEGYYGHVTTHSEELAVRARAVRPRVTTACSSASKARLAARFTWYAKAGYELRDYGNGTSAPGAVVAELELAYNFNERTKIDLRYRRANQSSIQYADQNLVMDNVQASLTQKFGRAEKLEGAVTVDYYNAAYNFNSVAASANTGADGQRPQAQPGWM